MTNIQTNHHDAAILNRLVQPARADFSLEAARAVLQLDFDQFDRERMHELSMKAQEGTLLPVEQ